MDTGSSATYEFGGIELRSFGTAGQFRVCSNTATPIAFVLYLNGIRSMETAPANSTCNAGGSFDVGAPDGDFTISGGQIVIFGYSGSGSSENYNLIGFGRF